MSSAQPDLSEPLSKEVARPTSGPPDIGCEWRWGFVLPYTIAVSLLLQGMVFNLSILSEPLRQRRPNWTEHAVPYALSLSAVLTVIYSMCPCASAGLRSGG